MSETKLRIRKDIVNPFGGIYFVIQTLQKIGLPKLIDKKLGIRPRQSRYSHSDNILSWIYSTFCGGDRIDDSKVLAGHMKQHEDVKFPSPVRTAGLLKSFAEPSRITKSSSGLTHAHNVNEKFSSLLLECCKKFGIFNQRELTLDYDNCVIPCEKFDTQFSYKGERGYQPGVAIVNNVPVFFENRNGNTPAAYKMDDTLKKCFSMLREHGVKIKRFRSDAAAYQKPVISHLEKRKIEFFIRAEMTDFMMEDQQFFDWKEITINTQKLLVTSIEHEPFADGKKYRFVITKYVDFKTNKTHRVTGENFLTRAIITNNLEWDNKRVVQFYNRRGDECERCFDQCLNDFNLSRLPFSFLEHNTVFMALTGIACAAYRFLLRKFCEKVPELQMTFRLKKFINRFITVASTMEDGYLILYDPGGKYQKLLI